MRETIEINSILRDFHRISGARISIHDIEFNEIYSYPADPTEFCKCIQQNDAVRKDCIRNDYTAFKNVKETKNVFVYKCRRGLYEAVAPIYHYGTLSGFLMLGQICDNSDSSMQYVIEKATEILGDKKTADRISRTVKRADIEVINSYINIMTVLAEYLTKTNRISDYNDKLPKLIKEYINKNYSQKITLSILSQKFECCNATLTKSFKNEYNLSIMSYLLSIRLEKSKEMIIKTRKSFKEIANECGFYDQNYFSKLFTKQYGISPTEFRSENMGN